MKRGVKEQILSIYGDNLCSSERMGVLIQVFSEQMDIIHTIATLLPEVSSIELAPDKMLEVFRDTVDAKIFCDNLPNLKQREIIRKSYSIYRKRGSEEILKFLYDMFITNNFEIAEEKRFLDEGAYILDVWYSYSNVLMPNISTLSKSNEVFRSFQTLFKKLFPSTIRFELNNLGVVNGESVNAHIHEDLRLSTTWCSTIDGVSDEGYISYIDSRYSALFASGGSYNYSTINSDIFTLNSKVKLDVLKQFKVGV